MPIEPIESVQLRMWLSCLKQERDSLLLLEFEYEELKWNPLAIAEYKIKIFLSKQRIESIIKIVNDLVKCQALVESDMSTPVK